jgi:hypothetical protein
MRASPLSKKGTGFADGLSQTGSLSIPLGVLPFNSYTVQPKASGF